MEHVVKRYWGRTLVAFLVVLSGGISRSAVRYAFGACHDDTYGAFYP